MRLVLISVLLSSPAALAQNQNQEQEKQKFSFFNILTGPMLPNQVDYITEIQPMWSTSYGFPYRKGHVELGFASSKGNGITYYNPYVGLRGDVAMDDIIAHFGFGIDSHYYYPPGGRPAVMSGGGHATAGFITLLGDNVYFRTDMKFNLSPGVSLYIGFGFEFRIPESADSGAEENK